MENYILIALGILFVLVFYLFFEIIRLNKRLKQSEVDALEQINLTIKSLDSEVQEIKKDFYKTIDEKQNN